MRTRTVMLCIAAAHCALPAAHAAPPIAPAAEPAEVPPRGADAPPLAGWHGGFFLRDPSDAIRLYPGGTLQVDLHGFLGAGVSDALATRLFVRRWALKLAGEVKPRWSFQAAVDLGGQPLSPGQAAEASARLTATFISVRVARWLGLTVGQQLAPFSMENRTGSAALPWMERNLAIRGLAVRSSLEIGALAWGDLGRTVQYEIGAFSGDGENRPGIDGRIDVMGRLVVRPFGARAGHPLEKAHIGVSVRRGSRDPERVGYDYPAITTGQGVVLWDPTYHDSNDAVVRVLPSGTQVAAGGELRLPVGRLELRGEAYYVDDHTREALDGLQRTSTERLGGIRGVGWYAEISAWPLGDARLRSDPGVVRPRRVDLDKDPGGPRRGLEVLGMVGAIHAGYRGAARGGVDDRETPGAAGGPGERITVFEYGVGATYRCSRGARLDLNYIVYRTPGGGSAGNLAHTPGSAQEERLGKQAQLLHEIGARVGVSF